MRFSFRAVGLLALVMVGLVLSACDTVTNGTKIDALETRNAQLQSTIAMVGTPALTIAALEQQATQNVVLQAQLNQVQITALAAQSTLTVLELSGGGVVPPTNPAPALTPNDQLTPPAASTPDSAVQTQFSQSVTATGLDAQDCALGAIAIFESTTDQIYIVTRINFLPANATLSAQWRVNGQLFFDDVTCWQPNQNWTDICAYCSITPDEQRFEAGNWTVDLLLDNQLMTQTQFQVLEATDSEEGN